MFRASLLIIGLIFSSSSLSGCGSDDNDNPMDSEGGPPPAEILGERGFQAVTVDGVAANLSDVMEWVPNATAANITIEANGAFVLEQVNSSGGQLWFESGFVFVDGSEVDINILLDSEGQQNDTIRLTFAIDNGTMTLEEVDDGEVIVFTLVQD